MVNFVTKVWHYTDLAYFFVYSAKITM